MDEPRHQSSRADSSPRRPVQSHSCEQGRCKHSRRVSPLRLRVRYESAFSHQISEFSDFTLIQSTMDAIGPVAVGQSVTTTLHLKSNATKITEIITVDLNLQGSGKVAEQTGISIAPGASQDVILSFKAPSSTGPYSISISSPQYTGPLASQTLQVTILQNNLQILIPAAIGIVAAIIILGVYLIKRQPETMETPEKTKPAGSKSKTPGSGNSPSKSLT